MDRDMQQRLVTALESIERHLRVMATAPVTTTGQRARRAALDAAGVPRGRTFTEDNAPPFGEKMLLRTVAGDLVVWNGKRWHWRSESSQVADAWPPEVPGPYFEVA